MSTNKPASKSKKIINYILFIVFAAFAYLQLNDPDSLLWFVIYLIVALICLLNNFINMPRVLIVLIGVSLLIYAGFHLSLFIEFLQTNNKEELFGEMVYDKPYLEGTREFIGLLMGAFAVLFQQKKY